MDVCKYTCDDQGVPRPATGKTKVRNLRVVDEVWLPALEKARAENRTLTEVIVTYLRRYISTPPRPERSSGAVPGPSGGRRRAESGQSLSTSVHDGSAG